MCGEARAPGTFAAACIKRRVQQRKHQTHKYTTKTRAAKCTTLKTHRHTHTHTSLAAPVVEGKVPLASVALVPAILHTNIHKHMNRYQQTHRHTRTHTMSSVR